MPSNREIVNDFLTHFGPCPVMGRGYTFDNGSALQIDSGALSKPWGRGADLAVFTTSKDYGSCSLCDFATIMFFNGAIIKAGDVSDSHV